MNKEIKVHIRIFLTLIFIIGYSAFSFGQDLYISQYIETNSGTSPKGVEIFNNTGSDITFSTSNYLEIYQGTNGASCSALTSTKVTSGILKNGEVWVIGTSDLTSYANTNGTNLSGTTTYGFAFNGDDALELYLGATLKDVFGTCGTDPGSSWNGNGVSTANQNIQILCGVGATTSSWTDPSTRFETVSIDPLNDMTGFGDAPSCVAGPEIQTQIPSGTDVACGYTYDFGTQTTGSNTNQTLRIKNTGNADLNISSYPLSGTNAGEFSISPASINTTITAGNSYDITVTFSPTSAGTKTAKITINSDDSDEGACVINLTGEGIDPCTTPTAQPTGLDLTTNITTTSIDGSFTAASPTADSYLVVYSTNSSLSSNPIDGTTYSSGDALGGGIVVGNISGTSFTANGLTSGTEYYFFIFANNNVSCSGGPKYNTTSPLTGNEITKPENPTWDNAGCTDNSSITLNWTAATGGSTGYLLVVREGATPHAITNLDPTTNLNENTDYSVAAQFGSTTEYSRILYKGTATTVTITNLPTASCTFKLYTYTIGSNGTDYIYSSGTQQTNLIELDNVSSAGSTCGDSQSSISWVNPSSACFDEVLVVANETSGIDFSPSGDGSSYTANTVYSGVDQVVYKGTGSNVTVTGLTNGTTYYFEIFTRKGTQWSSGVEVSCTPNQVTVLYQGDLAIVAVNTDIGGTGNPDEVCFFAFKDITNGTAIDFTDNGYERLTAGKWADSEGTIRIERNGNTIEKGTVICIQGQGHIPSNFTVLTCGTDDGNWTVSSLNGNYDFNLNVDDQIWIMQDGNWNNLSGSHNATYDGNILYGWTATGWKPDPGYDDTKGSTLFDNAECFNTNVTGTTDHDKVKFYTDISQTLSQSAWIGEINSSGNWTGYADNSAYDAGGLDYSGSCIKFNIDNSLGNGAGKWQGGEDNNWFNCANWLNMKVPDETIDVTILANAQNEANIDDTQEDANIYGPIAKCKNLTIEDGGNTIYVKIDDANDELQVKDVLTFESNGKLYNDNGGTLSVDGNLIINDGALLDMHANTTGGILKLKGNWTDNNTTDDNTHGFYETGGKVIFMGTTQQTISDATGNETFYDIQVNNANGVNLNANDITISNTLDLTSGKITTGSKNVIINNTATSAITNHSTNSYINGNLRRYTNATSSYDFPIGTSSQYELANINLISSTGITYFDSKFTNPIGSTDITSLGLTTDGTNLVTLLDYGYWTISPDAVSTVDYDITVTSRGHTNGGGLANQHTIVKRHDSSVDWVSFDPPNHNNSTQTGTGTNPITAKLTNLTTFSDYAIARSQENTLPIVLFKFTAKLNNGIVELNWITQTEINNDYFVVERSLNGINFNEITRVAGAGNSNTLISYNIVDKNTKQGILYYRLKQVDYNGDFTYSKIKTVNVSGNGINLNQNNIVISNNFIKIYTNSDEDYNVEIYNLNGQLIYNEKINESIEINISQYSKGIYLLKMYSKTIVYSKKIIK